MQTSTHSRPSTPSSPRWSASSSHCAAASSRCHSGLDHPYWVADPNLDLDFHIREIHLAKPGMVDQLADQVSRIVGRPMDRTRPLWEVYVIDGLHSGRWALLTKYHHATIDGAAGQLMLQMLTDPDPYAPPPGESPAWDAEPLPSTVELLRRTAVQLARNPFKAIAGSSAAGSARLLTPQVSTASAARPARPGRRSRPSPDSAAPTGRASPCRQRRRRRPRGTSRSRATADSPCAQRLWRISRRSRTPPEAR